MISASEAPALSAKLQDFISHGGSPQDAALVANSLNAAHSITDVMSSLQWLKLRLVRNDRDFWEVLDGRNTKILAFRLTETSHGAVINIL